MKKTKIKINITTTENLSEEIDGKSTGTITSKKEVECDHYIGELNELPDEFIDVLINKFGELQEFRCSIIFLPETFERFEHIECVKQENVYVITIHELVWNKNLQRI